MSILVELAQGLQSSGFGTALAESRYAFPVIEGIHLIGLSVSVGLIFFIDLRLVGVIFRQVPAHTLLRSLLPIVLWGFTVIFLTGVLLFISEADTIIVNPAFPVKLVLLFLGGLNALYFEFKLSREPEFQKNTAAILPAKARYSGLASLVLWTLVIIAGRLLAYL
ncbi:MAG: hypothetical protein LBS89_07110 [Zoogloeaceae bacterium]|jgi:hypothetical protein|nr:hypothetical protein [Zoogloeaceae bacterium]